MEPIASYGCKNPRLELLGGLMCGARHEYLTTPKTRLRWRDHIPVTWPGISHNIEVYPIHSLAEKKCGALYATVWLSGESTTSFQDAPSYTNSNPANAKGLKTEGGRLDSPDADS
ncbi:hypothetical protein JMJ77_0001437 [Colletotrichum scovillei]|uniref:Uncharacterized protein n=1 Tax=Colletotrichum scovillei TaxID=1209932 RepID=A0A9P7UKT0_9PEZI|nr:hypothetical protein JMJ77_0001437 [Colletotrichum scovillei]KAG7072661.1 hypothetical protein JMJ76_0005508 [Colletotrichum scovillei]KAG7080908.1 hypothetical protein JMJ78_0007991 [Colletotrichum scovillei]